MTEYEFAIEQDGYWQAGGTGPTFEFVRKEASHYALMYGQDGPVVVKLYRVDRTPLDMGTGLPTADAA